MSSATLNPPPLASFIEFLGQWKTLWEQITHRQPSLVTLFDGIGSNTTEHYTLYQHEEAQLEEIRQHPVFEWFDGLHEGQQCLEGFKKSAAYQSLKAWENVTLEGLETDEQGRVRVRLEQTGGRGRLTLEESVWTFLATEFTARLIRGAALYFDSDKDSNVIEVYVNRLHRKLGHSLIKTYRGQGYVFGERR